MLGPRAQQAWRDAGSPDPYCPGPLVDANTRYMGIFLSFFPRKNQQTNLFVANVYAPYSEMENSNPGILSRFYEKVESHLTHLPDDIDIILGGNFNASVGVRQDDSEKHVLGPNGFPHRNKAGQHVIDLARECQLRIAATFKKSQNYATFYDLQNDRAPRMLDMIATSQRIANRVSVAGTFQLRNGVITDHIGSRIKLRLLRPLSKSKAKITRLKQKVIYQNREKTQLIIPSYTRAKN